MFLMETMFEKVITTCASTATRQRAARDSFGGEIMKHMTTVVLAGMLSLLAGVAQAATGVDLQDTWINVASTNHADDMLGSVRWETVTFSTNGFVSWRWQRDGKMETHHGKYRIEAERIVKPVYRQRLNVMIIPETLAIRRSIVMKDVIVDVDHLFPATRTVLKWYDLAGNRMTFIREIDAKEREPSTRKIERANQGVQTTH